MRPYIIAIVLALPFAAGCSSTHHDHKTPVGMTRTTMSQRIAGQRLQASQVPVGDVSVAGHLAK